MWKTAQETQHCGADTSNDSRSKLFVIQYSLPLKHRWPGSGQSVLGFSAKMRGVKRVPKTDGSLISSRYVTKLLKLCFAMKEKRSCVVFVKRSVDVEVDHQLHTRCCAVLGAMKFLRNDNTPYIAMIWVIS